MPALPQFRRRRRSNSRCAGRYRRPYRDRYHRSRPFQPLCLLPAPPPVSQPVRRFAGAVPPYAVRPQHQPSAARSRPSTGISTGAQRRLPDRCSARLRFRTSRSRRDRSAIRRFHSSCRHTGAPSVNAPVCTPPLHRSNPVTIAPATGNRTAAPVYRIVTGHRFNSASALLARPSCPTGTTVARRSLPAPLGPAAIGISAGAVAGAGRSLPLRRFHRRRRSARTPCSTPPVTAAAAAASRRSQPPATGR